MPQKADQPIKCAAGCVAYRYVGAAPLFLLILDKYGRWTLPKGHLKAGEGEQAAAVREVWEETGITGTLGPLVGRIAYTISKNGALHGKQVAFFLLHAAHDRATPQADEGIGAATWFAAGEALALIGYPQIRDILARAFQMLNQA